MHGYHPAHERELMHEGHMISNTKPPHMIQPIWKNERLTADGLDFKESHVHRVITIPAANPWNQ